MDLEVFVEVGRFYYSWYEKNTHAVSRKVGTCLSVVLIPNIYERVYCQDLAEDVRSS